MRVINFIFHFIVGCALQSVLASDYDLRLSSNSPVVSGGTVQFKTTLYRDDKPANGDFKFSWEDNSLYRHTKTVETELPYDSWNITYKNCPPGPYNMQVTVYKYELVYYRLLTSQRLEFWLTNELNGELQIKQDNKTSGQFVSNNRTVVHEVSIKESDATYLKNLSTSILTYWFIDCDYHGVTDNFKYVHRYNRTDITHRVEALVVPGYEPVTTTTTTTTTTPKSTTVTTTATTTSTTASLNNAITKAELSTETSKVKRSVNNPMNGTTELPHELVFYNGNNIISTHKQISPESPFVCNDTVVPMSLNSTYGYFSRFFTVKAPVSKLTITGNNWILQGNILQLQISCKGSDPVQYCLNYFPGVYNISGNETCINPSSLNSCNFNINRYYGSPGAHTIVVIVINDVYKLITPITVTVYEVTKQAQLSVIVVPVTFTIVAIVLIIFGVAYHLQNRSRFIVEVADFNFGPQYADYMTFRERLRDSIMNAFTRSTVSTEEAEDGPIWPPNQKYGSMPRF